VRLPVLNQNEARVLGCLLEKAVTTPEQYPLSLNALMNACNQKSGREPVMSLSKGQVERAALDLAEQRLLKEEENFKTGMKKYTQRFCNTGMHTPQFDAAQYAIVTLLLLRGPQTPGELRARSGRLHGFEDNEAVLGAISSLMTEESNPLLVKLPRTPGRKDSEYMHLLSGPIEAGSYEPPEPVKTSSPVQAGGLEFAELAKRLTALEAEVALLKASLGE